MAHGSWVVKMVTSESRRDSSLRAVACSVSSTAWAVGSRWSVDAVVIPGDHGVIEDGDGAYRYLSLFSSPAGLGDGLGHEELVVHRSSDDT